jgi:hypothetical protein
MPERADVKARALALPYPNVPTTFSTSSKISPDFTSAFIAL